MLELAVSLRAGMAPETPTPVAISAQSMQLVLGSKDGTSPRKAALLCPSSNKSASTVGSARSSGSFTASLSLPSCTSFLDSPSALHSKHLGIQIRIGRPGARSDGDPRNRTNCCHYSDDFHLEIYVRNCHSHLHYFRDDTHLRMRRGRSTGHHVVNQANFMTMFRTSTTATSFTIYPECAVIRATSSISR